MGKSTKTRSRRTTAGALILAGLLVSGCATKVISPDLPTKRPVELGVAEIRGEWMQPCEGLDPNTPMNNVGDVLKDGINSLALLAECREKHNSLVDYLKPLVNESRK